MRRSQRERKKPVRFTTPVVSTRVTKKRSKPPIKYAKQNIGVEILDPKSVKQFIFQEASKSTDSLDLYAWATVDRIFEDVEKTQYITSIYEIFKKQGNVKGKLISLKNAIKESNRYDPSDSKEFIFTSRLTIQQMTEFMVFLWLDGMHDGYINYSFIDFLNNEFSDYCKTFFTSSQRRYVNTYLYSIQNNLKQIEKNRPSKPTVPRGAGEIQKRDIEEQYEQTLRTYTSGFGTILEKMTALLSAFTDKLYKKGYEVSFTGPEQKLLKDSIYVIFNISPPNIISSNTKLSRPLSGRPDYMYMYVDQETQITKPFTELIKGSSSVSGLRFLQNFVTTGSLLDPGRKMIQGGVINEIREFLQTISLNTKFTKLSYYIAPFKTQLLDKNGNPFFNINVDIRKPTAYDKPFIFISVNGVNVEFDVSKKKATNGTGSQKMGKFLGDNLPNFMLTHLNKNIPRSVYRPKFLGTGDGMNAVLYTYINKLSNNSNYHLMVDTSLKNLTTIHAYGLPQDVVISRATASRAPEPSRVVNASVNNNSEVTSARALIESNINNSMVSNRGKKGMLVAIINMLGPYYVNKFLQLKNSGDEAKKQLIINELNNPGGYLGIQNRVKRILDTV